MTCPKWPLFVAGVSTFLYTLAVLFVFTSLIGLHDLNQKAPVSKVEKVDEDIFDPDAHQSYEENVEVDLRHEQIVSYTIELVFDMTMLIACIFLLVGIKKTNHKFMAPWIYISIIDVVGDLIFVYIEDESKIAFLTTFASMVFIAAMWYPIFGLYKSLRHGATTESQPTPAAHDEQTPTAPEQV